MKTIVSASMLGCNLANAGEEIQRAEKAGIDWLHYDVMDGLFVPNTSFGEPILKSIKPYTTIPVDVHLMIVDPIRYIDNYADLGAEIITFHYEATEDVQAVIDKIRSREVKVGISIKPNTPVREILSFIDKVDMVLIMTVEPGFGGQGFIYETLSKIKELRDYLTANNLNVDIQVDGGINDETGALVRENGANILVSGSYIFNAENMEYAVNSIR